MTTQFSKHWHGKIFPDFFPTVRLNDTDKYFIGARHEIVLDGVGMGTAKIVAVRVFTFSGLRDTISFLDAGMSAAKFAGYLMNTYKEHVKGGVRPTTEFVHVIYHWEQRNFTAHQEYMTKFFREKFLDHQQTSMAYDS